MLINSFLINNTTNNIYKKANQKFILFLSNISNLNQIIKIFDM